MPCWKKELHRSSEVWKYGPKSPFPISLLHIPYLKSYETRNFVLFDERKGSPNEYIRRFFDALSHHVGDHNLYFKEFLKSLTYRAYTWYTTLAPTFIWAWKELESKFRKKYFQHEDKVTTSQPTIHEHGEDPMTFVRRFWDFALDCYYEKDKEALEEICIGNIVPDYRVYLDNIGISQFLRLLEAVRKTNMLVNPAIQRSWRNEKKEAYQALAVKDRSNYNFWKRKEKDGDRKTYLSLACNDE